ncbi:MAG: peptidase, partial [Nanoarchaeota archaeon]|nr:peptidase [Nanoarchaeota archaeon]
MLTLILSGGTGKNKEKSLNKLFLKLTKGKILYIPIAKETRSHEESYKWFTSNLRKKDVTMVTDLSKKVNLSKFKGIFIGGGNTFKLLRRIKENKWGSKLKNFKGIIYGGSAGAIIFGKDISLALYGKIKDKNKVKLKNTKGLNLVNYN